jgi:DNA polymerase alpha subunit A
VLASREKLEVDAEWYITQQILPPITRLIEHIDGIDVPFIVQCLGVDSKKYKYFEKKPADGAPTEDFGGPVTNPILATETEKNMKQRSLAELKLKCPHCHVEISFPGIVHPGSPDKSGL